MRNVCAVCHNVFDNPIVVQIGFNDLLVICRDCEDKRLDEITKKSKKMPLTMWEVYEVLLARNREINGDKTHYVFTGSTKIVD
jgi:hypothetical protein